MRPSHAQSRVPAGVPTGGQFAPTHRPEASGVQLVDDDLAGAPQTSTPLDADRDGELGTFLADRRERIRAGGYVAPTAATLASVDPRSSAYVRDWWEAEHATAEYGSDAGAYPQMPDDYTPSRTLGHSLSGHRRTHRMAYAGAGVSMRMPSVTSIRRYALELAGAAPDAPATFDVPVTATYPGGEVTGWVRVTRSEDGAFATRGLGFSKEASAYVAEGVQCLLEARRPTRALAETGSLLERRRQRAAQIGTHLAEVRSSWIKAAGYDKATGTMVVTTAAHEYGYRVPPEVFSEMSRSRKPGRVFNQVVRGVAARVEISRCERCERYTADLAAHHCPPKEAPRQHATPLQNELSRRRFLGES